MKTGYSVSDAMTENPIFVGPDVSIVDCASVMKENHVGALLVKEDDKVLGICTEQDMVRKGILMNQLLSEIKIKEIIDTNVKKISPDKDIFDAIVMMRDMNIRHLPVINKKGKFVGLLTSKDILKIEPQLFDMLADAIELREENNKPIRRVGEDEGICQLCGNYAEKLAKNKDGAMVCEKCKE
ncbi:MAG: CBS domain-containing protein [Candidatus Heimdallarchaeota archaeon]|nr:CBS domain-containing protein [Candidatus Heimdallarchaeota archaeon]